MYARSEGSCETAYPKLVSAFAVSRCDKYQNLVGWPINFHGKIIKLVIWVPHLSRTGPMTRQIQLHHHVVNSKSAVCLDQAL